MEGCDNCAHLQQLGIARFCNKHLDEWLAIGKTTPVGGDQEGEER